MLSCSGLPCSRSLRLRCADSTPGTPSPTFRCAAVLLLLLFMRLDKRCPSTGSPRAICVSGCRSTRGCVLLQGRMGVSQSQPEDPLPRCDAGELQKFDCAGMDKHEASQNQKCGKSRRKQPGLKGQDKSGAEGHPFICAICGNALSCHSQMAAHQTVPTGTRSFEGLECGQTFRCATRESTQVKSPSV